ncbi:hypothetical protein NDU88_004404 [Pleurodeles waltl]|uniref:Uncharacterized protein n=1 Tax=Pleurodeles waltl TaxID=8319 RepID=A0AAV7W9M6_PLEWA|nr:hypothetical protein NDU88_004404 [Pleurodeles waltl]
MFTHYWGEGQRPLGARCGRAETPPRPRAGFCARVGFGPPATSSRNSSEGTALRSDATLAPCRRSSKTSKSPPKASIPPLADRRRGAPVSGRVSSPDRPRTHASAAPVHRVPGSRRERQHAADTSVAASPGSRKRARREHVGNSRSASQNSTLPVADRRERQTWHGWQCSRRQCLQQTLREQAAARGRAQIRRHTRHRKGQNAPEPGGKEKSHLLRAARRQNAARSANRPQPHTAKAERAPRPLKAGPHGTLSLAQTVTRPQGLGKQKQARNFAGPLYKKNNK